MEVCHFGSMSLISGGGAYDNIGLKHETTFGVSPIGIFPPVQQSDPILTSPVASSFLVPVSFNSLFDWRCKYKIVAQPFFGEKLFQIGHVTCFKQSVMKNNWEYEVTGKRGTVELSMKEQKTWRPSNKDRVMIYDSDGQLSGLILGRFPSRVQSSNGQPLMKIVELPTPVISKAGSRIFRIFWDIPGQSNLLAQITRKFWRDGRDVRISTCLQFSREKELEWHYRMIVLGLTISIEHTIQRNIASIAKTVVV